ncbi:MAG: hypothetical protein N3A58_02025 [Spirochaetes bacterium]|nr:hypothetical protein [Spirochaetota bacterium]
MSDILVIGDKDSTMGFKSIGFDTIIVDLNNKEEQKNLLNSSIRKNYKIIFLLESIYKENFDTIEELTLNKLYPIVIAIPSSKERLNFSEELVEKLVIKALGGSFLK